MSSFFPKLEERNSWFNRAQNGLTFSEMPNSPPPTLSLPVKKTFSTPTPLCDKGYFYTHLRINVAVIWFHVLRREDSEVFVYETFVCSCFEVLLYIDRV